MKKNLLLLFLMSWAALIIWLPSSCTSDELPPPATPEFCDSLMATYDTHLKDIINASCAYTGCHDGGGTNGAPGNYGTYNGIQPFFANVQERVVNLRTDPSVGMPPDRSVYGESQKDNLTDLEFDIFKCWINAGFPEN